MIKIIDTESKNEIEIPEKVFQCIVHKAVYGKIVFFTDLEKEVEAKLKEIARKL